MGAVPRCLPGTAREPPRLEVADILRAHPAASIWLAHLARARAFETGSVALAGQGPGTRSEPDCATWYWVVADVRDSLLADARTATTATTEPGVARAARSRVTGATRPGVCGTARTVVSGPSGAIVSWTPWARVRWTIRARITWPSGTIVCRSAGTGVSGSPGPRVAWPAWATIPVAIARIGTGSIVPVGRGSVVSLMPGPLWRHAS